MSVRAYRAVIKYEKHPTFNLWHDQALCDFLNVSDGITDAGSGLIEVEVDRLREAVVPKKAEALGLEEWTIKEIKEDIKWAEKNGDTYIKYYCF